MVDELIKKRRKTFIVGGQIIRPYSGKGLVCWENQENTVGGILREFQLTENQFSLIGASQTHPVGNHCVFVWTVN